MPDLAFNIVFGQLIALCLVSGGVFTQQIQDRLQLSLPALQLACLYLPLTGYIVVYCRRERKAAPSFNTLVPKKIPIYCFLICAVVDIHATLLIVFAFQKTSITSVMLLEDFTIPSAFIMSVLCLKIKYRSFHLVGLLFCFAGMFLNLYNDIYIKGKEAGAE